MSQLPDEPLDPIFDPPGFLDWEEAYIRKAHRWAYKAILVALSHIPDKPYQGVATFSVGPLVFSLTTATYYAWFDRSTVADNDWKKRQETVAGTFRKMAQLMSGKPVRYQKKEDCTAGMIGMTQVRTGGPIILCPRAFDDDWLRWNFLARADWVRALTVVHEMAHAVGAVDVPDGYSPSECLGFAESQPAQAATNAQNYGFFALYGYETPPGSEQPPDLGMWVQKGSVGKGPSPSRAPAAAMIAEDILMLAYPEAPDEVGGRLWYKTLDLHEGREDWSDARLMQEEIRSVTAPALAVDDNFNVYCASIDGHSKLSLTSAGTNTLSSAGPGLVPYRKDGWDLHWARKQEIAGDVDQTKGPALAAFSGGYSSGIYCVYVKSGLLRCAVKFSRESKFTPVAFDKDRKAASAPALVVYHGQLKCVYRDEKGIYVTLSYEPATGNPLQGQRPGTWRDDEKEVCRLQLDTETVALAQWNTSEELELVALGRGKGIDWSLHYARAVRTSYADPCWLPDIGTRGCATAFGSAVVPWGRVLHSFHVHQQGWIDWITATAR